MKMLPLLIAAAVLSPPGPHTAQQDDGTFTAPVSSGAVASTVTLDAMPYTRTVTCSTYTLTGTYTGSAPTGWTASPSGDSGSCSDLGSGSFSCVVDVNPDASGEGVETITVTNGTANDTETIGFYVDGEHSCFLSQSVDGDYNSGSADLDAVTAWTNLGSSAKNVTQATGINQPTIRTGVVGGQPTVRFDGDDRLVASTASDWTFLSNGSDWTTDAVTATGQSNPNALQVIAATAGSFATTTVGFVLYGDDRAAAPANEKYDSFIADNSGGLSVSVASSDGAWPVLTFSLLTTVLDDDGGAGVDMSQFCNGSACGTGTQSGGYSAAAPSSPLVIGAFGGNTFRIVGDIFRLSVYSSALTSTQRGINKAVDQWALGGSLPATAADEWLFVGDSITAGFGGVESWPSKLKDSAGSVVFRNAAVGAATASQILGQWTANKTFARITKVFVLGGINDIGNGTSAAATYADLATIYSEASALGIQVIAMPTLPFGNAASWSAADQVQLELLEASIIADGNVDTLVNFYDLMGEPGTPEDLAAIYDNGDGVHPNEAGTTLMANSVATALGL